MLELYCDLALNMAIGWKSAMPYWKVHVGGVNIAQQDYINEILSNTMLMRYVDYICPHILTFAEWDGDLINTTYNNVKANGKKLSILEMSPVTQINDNPPLGKISRMNKLVGKADMYGIVLMIRNSLVGTTTDIDDIFIWQWGNPNNISCTAKEKRDWITNFNTRNYTDYEIEKETDMILDKIYQNGSRSIGVTFIQKVLNYDIDIDLIPKLVVDGWFGNKTKAAVKLYQKNFNLKETGIVDEITFKSMIFGNQNLFDELVYDCAVGKK